jgi:hypothetical protein
VDSPQNGTSSKKAKGKDSKKEPKKDPNKEPSNGNGTKLTCKDLFKTHYLVYHDESLVSSGNKILSRTTCQLLGGVNFGDVLSPTDVNQISCKKVPILLTPPV